MMHYDVYMYSLDIPCCQVRISRFSTKVRLIQLLLPPLFLASCSSLNLSASMCEPESEGTWSV